MTRFLTVLTLILLFSCSKKTKEQEKIEQIPVTINVARFDKDFFETSPSNLASLKKKYPSFFPTNTPDNVWIEKMTNPQWRELYAEVEKKYSNFDTQKKEIETLFKHIKYYFPKTKTPKVVTLIYDMDANYKTIYADSLVLISLEMYLGKKHKFYEYPEYEKANFEPSQILPDIVQDFSVRKVKPPVEKNFLSYMIYAGKQMYLKDILLPEYSDEVKIGYTPKQLEWCAAHDVDIWRYFVDNNLLYSTNTKLLQNFIAPAPFSKFGMVNDSESPGRIGVWMGWQIVRAYMQNTNATLQQMLVSDANDIFKYSKYKPTK